MTKQIPNLIFKTRQKSQTTDQYQWQDVSTDQIFANKRVVLFALPGAFTPTCSSTHLPGYEIHYDQIRNLGIDEVFCLSVNDSFTMNAWFEKLDIQKVKPIPDGSADFTRLMGYMVYKHNLGFGARSWRYSMVINNGEVETVFVEPGIQDNADQDPFVISDVHTMIEYLKSNNS
jgi:peroxiredoxin